MNQFRFRLKEYLKNITPAVYSYSQHSTLFLILLLFAAAYETLAGYNSHVEKLPFLTLSGSIFINYIIYWLKTYFFFLVPYVIIHLLRPSLANFFYVFFAIFLLLLQFALIEYFHKSMVPLGADLFAYSIDDIKQTVGASGGISLFLIVSVVTILIVFIFVFWYYPEKIIVPKYAVLIVSLFSFVVLTTGFSSPIPATLKTEYSRTLVLNKSDYFITEAYRYFNRDEEETDIYSDSYSGDFGNQTLLVKDFDYVNEQQFPFLHKEETEDVLSPFFNKSERAPNIVILLVEGLGRSFTNEGAALGNFTPFLDSLSGKSLYWENFLSSAGRSFAVLPSVLGSLPFAKNGFNELGKNMPEHLSLASISAHNGYRSAFFYGGDSKFDNMNLFAKKDGINEVYDEFTFPTGYTKLPAQNGFTWGYGDQELFRRYLEVTPKETQQPQLNILFTVAMHSPFLLNNPEKYNSLFEKRMNQLGFPEDKKRIYRQYKSQYSSILFFDESLKIFINNYKKRSDFNNTIFIITGDHRMPEIPMISKIDQYHVPLVIYSPLLKRTATFSSISSHFDIAPSVLAYLKNSYQFEIPTLATWMGSGLDTARAFRNIHQYPLMQTKNEVIDFVQGTSHLNSESLFSILPDMNEETEIGLPQSKQLNAALKRFKVRNQRFINGDRLIPDSIYSKYFPH
jgi:uncharacterized sulfatase